MAARKKTTRKASSRKASTRSTRKSSARSGRSAARRRSDARKRLQPARESRGLDAREVALDPSSPDLDGLAEQIRDAGGSVIGAYREPLAGHPMLLAVLPLRAVEPTPYQRDLSPTHTKRLAAKIDESGSFLDPLIVVRGEEGSLWTPNGRHRLAAAKVLGLRLITCLVSPDEDLAFKILALNTEKAHNLKDRSLEVIRMARSLAQRRKRTRESELAAEFEEPALLTLGIVYEQAKRFAGGAYHPFLRKVDRFSERTLAVSLRERSGHAARLLEIDEHVKRVISGLQERGFKSPYLRSYVVARINPVRFHRAKPGAKAGANAPAMPIGAALTKMSAAVRRFDLASVRERDLALVAAVATEE